MAKSLSGKLYFTISFLVFLVFVTAIYSLTSGKGGRKSASSDQEAVASAKAEIINQIQVKLGMLSKAEFQAAYSPTPDLAQAGVTAALDLRGKVDELIKKVDDSTFNEKEKPLFTDFTTSWKDFTENSDKISAAVKESKMPDAQTLYKDKIDGDFIKMFKNFEDIAALEANEASSAATTASASDKDAEGVSTFQTVFLSITMLLSLGIFGYSVSFVRPSSQKMVDSSDNLKQLGTSSSSIGNSLQESSNSLSSSVTRQASSIHDTSAAIDEITSMINRTSENAKESLTVAKESSKKAEEGEKIMERMVAAMEAIQESSAQLTNIANIISQINSKTAVINEIVSKTELLSLNASIESARAGEHGKGFAVVAEEVGNLAKVSGKSANEIQALIQSSQEQVNQIIHSTKLRVEDGKKVTNEAQDTFHKISENISNMSSVIEQITEATKEQEIGIRQISSSMLEMDKVTKDNQAIIHSNADFAHKLLDHSKKIEKISKDIHKIISGSSV